MVKVSSAEFQRKFGHYQDVALGEPVTITRNGRERTVMISAEEYQRLIRGRRRVFKAGELTKEQIAALKKAKVPDEYKYLNAELKGWRG